MRVTALAIAAPLAVTAHARASSLDWNATAAPVAEELRAEPLARRLAHAMSGLHDGMCK